MAMASTVWPKQPTKGQSGPSNESMGIYGSTRGHMKRRGHHDALRRPTSNAGPNCAAALLFRRTYTLTEERRWRVSIRDSPRYLLQNRLERGTVETARPRASGQSDGAPSGHGRVSGYASDESNASRRTRRLRRARRNHYSKRY
jgi:hypothetical protein